MNDKTLKTVLAFLVLGCVCGLAGAGTTWHVDGDNPAAGDGTAANPFQTIEVGLAKATQGERVLVHKVDGMVNGSEVGPLQWGHYLLASAITIEANETLELEPGVVLKFKYYTNNDKNPSIVVEGCLRSMGQAGGGEKSVYLTSERDNTVGASTYVGHAPEAGDWYRILFADGSDDSGCLIEHSEVRYAGRYQWYKSSYPSGWRSQPEQAILMASASPTIRNTIVAHTYGDALRCNLTSSPTLEKMTFEGNSINGLHILGGTIEDERSWSNTDVVYYLDSPVTVAAGPGRLTMRAGLVVKFQYSPSSAANPSLIINGCLRVLGTSGRPVILTSSRDDTAQAPDGTNGDTNGDGPSNAARGDWYHIVFNDSSDDSGCLVEHAEIRYGGQYWWYKGSYPSGWRSQAEEAILMTSASPTVRDTLVRDTYGDALECNLTSSPTLERLTFENNSINGLNVLGGTIEDSRVWSNSDVAYYLDSSVAVAEGTGRLTIDEGVVVKFQNYSQSDVNPSLLVSGCLRVLGTRGRPVIFTSIRDDTAIVPDGTNGDTNNDGPSNGARGDWYHIVFGDSSGDSCCLMEHAEVRFAGQYWWYKSSYPSGWRSEAHEGILMVASSPAIRDVRFSGCWGYPVEMDLDSFPRLSNLSSEGVDSADISAVHIVGGTMNAGGAWSNPGIPYYLDSSVTVAADETLVIDPGTVLKFKVADNIGIYFDRSKLDARQLGEEPRVFTSIRDDDICGDTNNDGPSNGGAGDWGQLRLANTGRPNLGIRDAVFRYAGNGSGNKSVAAVELSFADAEIVSCTFEQCLGEGVKLDTASIADIREIVSLRNDVGIRLTGGSEAVVAAWTSFQDQTAFVVDNAYAELYNSILAYYSFNGAGGYGVQVLNGGAIDKLCNCDVWSPWGTKYSDPPGDQTGQCGNISRNPKFVDIFTDNLHLADDSPCLDKGGDPNAVYKSCKTVDAGSVVTLKVGTRGSDFLVGDWIAYDGYAPLLRVTAVDVKNGIVTFAPRQSAATQSGKTVNIYGFGDMDLHPRIGGDDVDMGADEYWPQFVDSDCLDVDSPAHDDWQLLGKPECWCGLYGTPPRPYQCDGDADGEDSGVPFKYRVFTGDLAVIVKNWRKNIADPTLDPCADLDHEDSGVPFRYRVFTGDLGVLVSNWRKTAPGLAGDCPRSK